MVKVREDHPVSEDGRVDIEAWLDKAATRLQIRGEPVQLIRDACALAEEVELKAANESHSWDGGIGSFRSGLEIAEILMELQLDAESIIAAVLYRAVREGKLELIVVEKQFGKHIALLIEGVLRMAAISAFLNPSKKVVLGQISGQLDNLRKMLVAMVDDVRVALIKLAERTLAIRSLAGAPEEKCRRVAREVFDIYAPLAHRLGIGHIKWELEDISFRYLQPAPYKRIAKMLDERRVDRQVYIDNVIDELGTALSEAGVKGELTGRVKHIYSIWRKMCRKNIDFNEVYDIRAVRILVPDVRDCYAALGLVHATWQHIPREFDDYIATPKENGYRSLHTAVFGPDGKVLEVQIRTHDMHEEAELGVCAHWHYKEGSKSEKGGSYEGKIAWLRQVLEWQEQLGDAGVSDIVAEFRHDVIEERVYVFTPDGHVVDLSKGATPLDFAYYVHTEVGHSCRGAKVNGRIVPLNYQLKTGEQVVVLTAKGGSPSRDWLNQNLGYLKTSRARAKVQHWFKEQDRDRNIVDGRLILEKEFQRLAIGSPSLKDIAPDLNLKSEEDIFAAVGAGDVRVGQVINALSLELGLPSTSSGKAFEVRKPSQKRSDEEFDIHGLSNLMTHVARCCNPVPGDYVLGYISSGRGVTVHKQDCPELLRLQKDEPDRIIDVTWNEANDNVYPVDVYIKAYDRQGLLMDITSVLANEHLNVIDVNTHSDKKLNMASMSLRMETKSLSELGRVLDKISQLPNVFEVRRRL